MTIRGPLQRLSTGLALALVTFALTAGSAAADHVAGAVYSGVLDNGATIEFTVSADGTRLVRYRIANVKADTCLFLAQGEPGEWETPLTGESFDYRLYDAILFRGTFTGPASASGTFRMFNPAVGAKPACDTGTVKWAATTGSAPAPGTAGAPDTVGAPVKPSSSSPAATRRTFRTRVTLRKRTGKLTGRVASANRTCIAGRRLTLRRGSRTIRSTTSRPDGTFSLPIPASARGRAVRVVIAARKGKPITCAAVTSKLLKA